MFYNIKEYGAVGDGVSKDTSSIQKTIDTCSAQGGGRVIVPPGEFLTGTVFLKNNVDLHLMPGATIKGSPDTNDYNADNSFSQNAFSRAERWTGAHLIIALEAQNVSISGRGTIDGNGLTFFEKVEGHTLLQVKNDKRPGQMIYFCECTRVRVEDVLLNNPPCWTCFCHGCKDVSIRNVQINSSRETKTTDGIDIDSCCDVTISDCIVNTGDDSITIRGNNKKLKSKNMTCENIVVSNCVLTSGACAFRVGVGTGLVRNCVIGNCVIRNSRTGIHIISSYSASSRGTDIENIRFSNMFMDAGFPFWVMNGKESKAKISDIIFNDMKISAESGAFICGLPATPISNIAFRNIDMKIRKTDRKVRPAPYPVDMREWDMFPHIIPHAFYAAYVDDISFNGVNIHRDNELIKSYDEFKIEKQPEE